MTSRTKFTGLRIGNRTALLGATASALLLTACGGSSSGARPEVVINGTNPVVPGSAARPAAAVPDANGVVVRDGYEAVIARSGDTVQSVADRLGLSATELGAYNGLSSSQRLAEGQELVLPPKPEGYSTAVAETVAPAPGGLPAPASAGSIATLPSDVGVPGAAPASATFPSPVASAPGAGSVTPTESGWTPARAAEAIERGGASAATPVETAAAPIEPPVSSTGPGPATAVSPIPVSTPDPVATAPVPGATATAAVEPPTAPAPAPVAGSARLLRPVEGEIAIGYNPGSGPARSDGIEFAADAGAPVRAADGGTVALVSQSLGGLGTIVLVRHEGGLLTVYGRLSNVTVTKGDRVSRGQQIGQVARPAPPAEPRMHFEVRRGAESVNPLDYL